MLEDGLSGTTVSIVGFGISRALSIRLMTSSLYVKHAHNLSNEHVVELLAEKVAWQYFSGLDYYEPKLPYPTRWSRTKRELAP